jgi:hypothetical protein
MISSELANLSDYLLGHAAKGLRLAPEASIHLARVLLDLSRQAKQLEAKRLLDDIDNGVLRPMPERVA